LKISRSLPDIGEEVTTAGYHGNYSQPSSSVGIVSQITEHKMIMNDLTILPGMSGSPLVLLKTNEVVGVNTQVNLVQGAYVRLNISTESIRLFELKQKLDSDKKNEANTSNSLIKK
jgi:hypothetical protein